MSSMDIHRVLSLLPHRYPFLLIDRVIDYKPEDYLVALKNVSYNEPFFNGHFPVRPVMPGVLILYQGAWFDPDEDGVDHGGCANVLTTEQPSRIDHGNAQMATRAAVRRV